MGYCFQGARLEAKAALRWLGRCKGTLQHRASISVVREGYIVLWCGLFVVCVCVFADLGLLSGCKIGNEGCVALAGALQGHSALQSIDLSSASGIFCCLVWEMKLMRRWRVVHFRYIVFVFLVFLFL